MADSVFQREFSAWLGRVCRGQQPPPSVKAFNIGLIETTDGYSAYLTGAREYSEDDADWAGDEAFTPHERYFQIPGKWTGWEQVREAAVEATKAFLASPEGMQSYLAAAQAVTVGFDDGDLERVR